MHTKTYARADRHQVLNEQWTKNMAMQVVRKLEGKEGLNENFRDARSVSLLSVSAFYC